MGRRVNCLMSCSTLQLIVLKGNLIDVNFYFNRQFNIFFNYKYLDGIVHLSLLLIKLQIQTNFLYEQIV